MNNPSDELSFWGHLDELRAVIIKISIATVIFGVLAFLFKEQVYAVILAPKEWDFITYRVLHNISNTLTGQDSPLEKFSVELINTALAGQFVVHMKTSIYIGAISVLPYILYLLFQFISPALYATERRVTFRIVTSSYLMFMAGVALTYFVIFPLTFKFLGTYQVSDSVSNSITLQSYLGAFSMLSLAMGCVFEIPILSWLLAKFGVINATMMRQFRRHVIVVLLIIAAIITPTTDIFTLLIVSLPMYLLYEASILLVKKR
ncbi:MAG: twin-arginine translocase subunit TatC [Rikenellaceae bacterium]